MAAWGYEFYLLVMKVSLTRSLRSSLRDTFSTEDKVRIPAGSYNILYTSFLNQVCTMNKDIYVKTEHKVKGFMLLLIYFFRKKYLGTSVSDSLSSGTCSSGTRSSGTLAFIVYR